MYKPMKITSRNLEIELPKSTNRNIEKEHLTIIIKTGSRDDAEHITKELQKAVWKMNRQGNKKISYTIFKDIRRHQS